MYNTLINTLNNKLPIEVINIILTYSRSKEAEIFIDAVDKVNKHYFLWVKDTLHHDEWSRNVIRGMFKKRYVEVISRRNRIRIFGDVFLCRRCVSDCTRNVVKCGDNHIVNKNDKPLTIDDLKKMCKENGLKRKSFKTKQEWIKYYIKNT